jgi:hypothetical protein
MPADDTAAPPPQEGARPEAPTAVQEQAGPETARSPARAEPPDATPDSRPPDEDDRRGGLRWPWSGRRAEAVEESNDWAQTYLVILLGVALGLQDIFSAQASGWLRVPALVAALLLVAHGVFELEKARRGVVTLETDEQADLVVSRIDTVETVTYATGRKYRRVRTSTSPPRDRENSAIMNSVLVLSLWLGIATLAFPTAPPLLLLLSLIASFVLFITAYQSIQGPQPGPSGDSS